MTVCDCWQRGMVAVATASGMFILAIASALAAEISLSNEYATRISDLRRLYPVQSPNAIVAARHERRDYFGTPGVFNPFSIDPRPTVLRFEGEIVGGDGQRLRDALAGLAGPVFISFDSPGGIFVEAFEIADVIVEDLESQDPRIGGVIVLAGDECLSACAIAFAASFDRAHPTADDVRFVERGARLGFHMPYVPEGTALPADGGRAMLDLGYNVADFMVRLLDNNANPPELLTRMLKYRDPEEFYVLDGDFETWRLGFSPVAPSKEVTPVTVSGMDTIAAGMICNLMLTGGRAHLTYAEDEFCDFQLGARFVPRLDDNLLLTRLGAAQGPVALGTTCESFSCQIRTNGDYEVGAIVWRGGDGCPNDPDVEDNFPTQMCSAEPIGVHHITNHFLAEAFSCRDGELLDRTFSSDQPPIVKNDVNLRAAPTTDAAVVTQLKSGAQVGVIGCRITTDGQGVWYRVRTADGAGWVSARFVGGHAERFQYRGTRFGAQSR